jgi:TonB family protein
MNRILKNSALLVFAALSTSYLGAAIESVKIEATVVPVFSPSLIANGVTEGRVALAIAVDANGAVTDWLPLGYSHRQLVEPCVEALKHWKITPARVDGQPVPAQTDLVIEVTASGTLRTHNIMEEAAAQQRRLGLAQFPNHILTASEIDRTPVPIATVPPKYAEEAKHDGVQGKVEVRFYIDEKGDVRMPSVVDDPHPYLAEKALEAVRQWKFQPPTLRGTPVTVAASQEFNFGDGK